MQEHEHQPLKNVLVKILAKILVFAILINILFVFFNYYSITLMVNYDFWGSQVQNSCQMGH